MNNAIIYTRVSSDEQKKTGFSLDFQAKQGQEYAQKIGLNVVEVYSESCTAKKPGRPLFNEMNNFATKRKINHIIFLKNDRASRNGVDSAQLVYMAEYLGFNIHLIQDGLVLNKTSRPTDYMIFEIANCMANFYPRNLSIDVSTKLREKAEQGYYPERPPVGYMRKPNLKRAYLQINPTKAPLIKRVFELYATGLYSYTTLAKQLREEGFQISPSVKVGRSNIEDILNNPIYIGDFIFKGKRYYNAKHDPIVSREIYAICQKIIAEHTSFRPNKKDFLFTSMIKCSKCNCTFTAEIKKGRYVYYHCTGNKGGHCKKTSYIREEKIEEKVLELFSKFEMSDKILELAKNCLLQEYKNKYGDNEARITQVEEEIKKEKQKLNRLLDLFISGACSEEIYNKKSKEIEKHIDDLTIRMRSYNKTGFDILHYSVMLFELMKNAVSLYKTATTEEKRKLLNIVCSNLLYDGENLTIIIKKAFQPLVKIANLKMVEDRRFELLTPCVQGRCSTS